MILPRSFSPSLPESWSCPPPGVRNQGLQARRQEAGTRSARAQLHLRPAHPKSLSRTPRRPSWPAQPGIPRSPGPPSGPGPPRRAQRSSAAGHCPARQVPADPKGKKPPAPGAPRSHPRSTRRAGGRPGASGLPGSGPKLTRCCERRCYRWRTRRCHSHRCPAGPAPAGRSCEGAEMGSAPAPSPAPTGAGVTVLRRRCSLALLPGRCPPPGRRSLGARRSSLF